jgi:hypothetical protein
MRSVYILLLTTLSGNLLQSCGINNYFKAKKLREAIATEDKRTENLIKKRDAEKAKLQVIKDSAQRYRQLLKGAQR